MAATKSAKKATSVKAAKKPAKAKAAKKPAKAAKPAKPVKEPEPPKSELDLLAERLGKLREWDACAELRKMPAKGRGALAVQLVERGVNVRGVAFDEDDGFARACVAGMLRQDGKGIDFQAVLDGERVVSVASTQLRDVVFDELKRLGALETLESVYAPPCPPPPWFGELSNLTQLRFARADFKALPPVIGELGKLRDLSIEFGTLQRLGAPLAKLRELRTLMLACPEITELPSEVCALPKLETLRLPRARMKTLPPQIGKLGALVELDISYSQINAVPDELAKCKSLKTVRISYSKLKAKKLAKLLPGVQIIDDANMVF